MTHKIKTAVILAAGKGIRLHQLGEVVPKGFLKLGVKPIIEESIECLQCHGIERIIIVTGHRKEFYEQLGHHANGLIETIYNDQYEASGTMYSLYLARSLVDDDFLLLESDLIYEQHALSSVINFPQDNAILLSGLTNSRDEVFVESKDNTLVAMSKNRSELGKNIAGELVGISKISQSLFSVMIQNSELLFKHSLYVDYEMDALVKASASHPVYCHLVPDLIWSEIDDIHHLNRARDSIYPNILKKQYGFISK